MTALTSYIPKYSYQDYKNWKEDWELIGGYPWSLMPSPKLTHGRIQIRVVVQADSSLLKNRANCNCKVYSEIDWKVNEDTVVRPDVMIVCGETKTDYLEFPPSLILEVLSVSTRMKDRNVKFQLYQEQGVKYYLLADCDKRFVEVFELIDNVYRQVIRSTFLLENDCEVSFDFNQFWD